MKRVCALLCSAILLFGTVGVAQQESYREQVNNIVEAAQNLDDLLKTNAVGLAAYDKWYKDFSDLHSEFKKNFFNTHRQRESFKSIQQAYDTFASAWNKLNQAEYSEEQYKEYITLNNVASAHNWKNTAISQRKEALDAIGEGIELIGSAENLLEEEDN
jgi:hypothetical protein